MDVEAAAAKTMFAVATCHFYTNKKRELLKSVRKKEDGGWLKYIVTNQGVFAIVVNFWIDLVWLDMPLLGSWN